jgi:CDP-diacylglycerol--glycerol-3-phosphate 3-phosphatidyltransferase
MARGSLLSPELRSTFRTRVEPLAALFGRVGLTPNALTVIGLAIAVVAAAAAANQEWLAAGLLVVFGAAFDLFDGALARATGQTSKFGAFLDSTLDRAGEAVVYLGILVGLAEMGYANGPGVAAAAMAAAFMVSYTRAKSESLGFTPGSGMANVGLAPREIRIAILTLGLVVAGLLPGRNVAPPDAVANGGVLGPPQSWLALVGALLLITLLATITTIQRILAVRAQAQTQPQSEETR